MFLKLFYSNNDYIEKKYYNLYTTTNIHNCLYTYTFRGVCRISQGGGPTLKFLGFWICMPRSGMSRAAELRAFARGVWGHAPQENLLKWCNSVGFKGYFQPLS